MILCPTMRCGAVLRQMAGVDSAGDAPMLIDPDGAAFLICPECRVQIPWPPAKLIHVDTRASRDAIQ